MSTKNKIKIMKTKLFFLVLIALSISASAQDTIVSRHLKDTYFHNFWPREDKDIQWRISLGGFGINSDTNVVFYEAKRFYSLDTIQVYGVVIACNNPWLLKPNAWWPSRSHSLHNSWEYFSLYLDADGVDSLVCISDSLIINLGDIAYCMDMDLTTHNVFQFYEGYFNHPYSVCGRFYIARSFRSYTSECVDSITGEVFQYETLPVAAVGVDELECIHRDTCILKIRSSYQSPDLSYINPDTIYWVEDWPDVCIVYPIIAPPEGAAVDKVNTADRLVLITPNPTSEKARVVSSCGMSRITAYNTAGEMMYSQEVSGTSANVPVAGWPSGCYIFHVKTPMGTAVKKLMVN